MEVINKIKIDLLRAGVKPIINAMQADENSRVLEITLNANGDAWEIPDGVSFSVAYKKPDGTRGLYDTMPDGTSASSADGNVLSIRLAPQMLTAPGTVNTSVVISSGDQRISTFPIIVNVIQNPAVGAVGSEDYFYSSVIGNLDDLKTTNKSSLVAAINEIFSTGGSGSNSGQNVTLSTAQINALDGIFKVCAFTKADVSAEYAAFRTAFGLTDSGGGEEEPDTPDEPVVPEVTLTSISAVYGGGNVPVGTDVTALTGIVVTGHYSDGTTKAVTGYTLSGTIAEGSNTVTVSYGGKSTTITVVGIAESGGDEPDIPVEPEAEIYEPEAPTAVSVSLDMDSTLINTGDGTASSNASWVASDYAQFPANNDYMVIQCDVASNIRYALYDGDKKYISGNALSSIAIAMIEIPENAAFVRLSSNNKTIGTVKATVGKNMVTSWGDTTDNNMNSDGTITEGFTGAKQQRISNGYVKIPDGVNGFARMNRSGYSFRTVNVSFYDKNFAFVHYDESDYLTNPKIIPISDTGAVYFKASAWSANNANNNDPSEQIIFGCY